MGRVVQYSSKVALGCVGIFVAMAAAAGWGWWSTVRAYSMTDEPSEVRAVTRELVPNLPPEPFEPVFARSMRRGGGEPAAIWARDRRDDPLLLVLRAWEGEPPSLDEAVSALVEVHPSLTGFEADPGAVEDEEATWAGRRLTVRHERARTVEGTRRARSVAVLPRPDGDLLVLLEGAPVDAAPVPFLRLLLALAPDSVPRAGDAPAPAAPAAEADAGGAATDPPEAVGAAPEGGAIRGVWPGPDAPPYRHFPSTRAPNRPVPFVQLPPGATRPRGWLHHQLRAMADGMVGRLDELSPWCVAEGNAWLAPDGEGHSPWEELPYWLRGLVELALVLDDPALRAKAEPWVEGILASQREGGWFGPEANRENNDVWPNAVAAQALRSWAEGTGDPRVLPFLERWCRWLWDHRDTLLPGSWQKVRGGDTLETILWVHARTGESWLLDLARVVHERTARWDEGVASWHGVNIAEGFREPAEWWVVSGDPADLDAADAAWMEVMRLYGEVPGGMFAADENCRRGYDDPRQAAETCTMVEMLRSTGRMLAFSGDARWATRAEEIAFNSLPAAALPDWRGLRYLTAPNLVSADAANKAPALQNGGCMLAFTPHRYRCCQHNAGIGWPSFVRQMVYGAPRDGVAVVQYADSVTTLPVGADGVPLRLEVSGGFPFTDRVVLRLGLDAPTTFPLMLRIPDWCLEPRVEVDGIEVPHAGDRPWAALEQEWEDGAEVVLSLKRDFHLYRWAAHHGAVSLKMGPLWLAYPVPTERRFDRGEADWGTHDGVNGPRNTPEWPGVEYLPAGPWNWALLMDETGRVPVGLEPDELPGPVPQQPWTPETVPSRVRVHAQRAPSWRMEDGLVAPLQESPIRTEGPITTIELVPMGAARLRISVFPVAGGKGGHVWKVAPPPPPVSYCWSGDTPRAVNDGILGTDSGDVEVPRLTWWWHKGTTEWVEQPLGVPTRIGATRVQWFDDRPAGECALPASWRLLYRGEDGAWHEVEPPDGFPVVADAFLRVSFPPVTSDRFRLEVRLQDGWSGGVLEWELEPAD